MVYDATRIPLSTNRRETFKKISGIHLAINVLPQRGARVAGLPPGIEMFENLGSKSLPMSHKCVSKISSG